MIKPLSFGADARLTGGNQFQSVFRFGKKTPGRAMTLWYSFAPSKERPRLGLCVSSKIGNAVKRNRVKRLLRETFRLNQNRLPPGLNLIISPKSQSLSQSRDSIERQLFDLLSFKG